MKKLILVGLWLPLIALAQTYGGFEREELEPLIQQAQQCMDNVDQDQLLDLQEEALIIKAEVEAHCVADERDEAQEKSIAFAREALQKPVVKEWQQCMGVLGQTLPLLALVQMQNPEVTGSHVCDLPQRLEQIP